MKVICFDIGSVLLQNCPRKMMWQIVRQPGGLANMLGYLAFDKNRFRVTKAIRHKVCQLFDRLAELEGVDRTNGRFPTEQGIPLANSVQRWQRGEISDDVLLERVLVALETLTYSTKFEKELSALVAEIVTRPELHVKAKKQIPGMQKLVEDLAKRPVKLVITSNIDRGLAQAVRKEFPQLFGHFHDFFGSGDLGVMKPNPEFFRLVAHKHQVKPEEVLVIDDLSENIAAAHEDVGCQVFHFDRNPEQLRSMLVQLGVLTHERNH